MAEYFEAQKEQVNSMIKSLNHKDGIEVNRLLNEVGSCGWRSLMGRTQDWTYGWTAATNLSSDGYTDTLQVLITNGTTTVPLTTVTDKSCKRK